MTLRLKWLPLALSLAAFWRPASCLAQGSMAASSTPADVYLVPFSHLDLFWAGTREETLARGNRIIARAIQIARAHPEFRFLLESNNFVANYVETHPGSPEVDELRRLVQQGRFEIAPSWAEIFLNLPDGEVLARNLLYGRRYARLEFGVDPRVFHPGDVPGFPPQLPQLLDQAHVPYLVMTRLGPFDRSLFDWQAPDGSKVLVWNAIHGYDWGIRLHLHEDLTPAALTAMRADVAATRPTSPGPLLMHWGLDLWSPTEKLVTNSALLAREQPGTRFTLATPKDYFEAVARTPNLATLRGEVPLGWPHVVDGILHLWQLAIPATRTLGSAERFAAINHALGYAPYPQADFEALWKRLLESMDHNHDGQGGELGDARKMEFSREVIDRGGDILRDMLRNIAERVQLPVAHSFPIVVFNALSWERSDVVRAHVTLFGDVSPAAIADFRRGLRLVDERGTSVPFTVDQTSENISRAVDLTFVARGVPSLGYRTYFLVAASSPDSFPATSRIALDRDKDFREPRRSLGVDTLENAFYTVTIDKATGRLGVFDKELRRAVVQDAGIAGVEERGTNNVEREIETGRTVPMVIDGTVVEKNDVVRTVIRIPGRIGDIPVVQRVTLYRDLKRVDLENSVDWREQRLLRLEQQFPTDSSATHVEYGVAFGADSLGDLLPGSGPRAGDEIQRSAWEQYRTIQDWVSAGNADWGVTVAADHQLVRLQRGLIRAQMIRGQRYTSARIVRDSEVTSIHFPAPGRYVFRYTLTSGPGDWKAQRSFQTGAAFNDPLMPVSVLDEISPKSLPPTYSFLHLDRDNVVVSALKKAEADAALVLRAYEIEGQGTATPIAFLGRPSEIEAADLLEAPAPAASERLLRFRPFEIRTVKLRVAPAPKPDATTP